MPFLNIIQCGKCGTWIVIGEWQRNFGVCNGCSDKKLTIEELRPSMVKIHPHIVDYSRVNNLKEDFKELQRFLQRIWNSWFSSDHEEEKSE